jgi:hypothetical protein
MIQALHRRMQVTTRSLSMTRATIQLTASGRTVDSYSTLNSPMFTLPRFPSPVLIRNTATSMIHDTTRCFAADDSGAISIRRRRLQRRQLLPDQSEQEGVHTFPCTLVLRLDRQEGCVNYVSPFGARLVKPPSVGRKKWHLATLQYHRWTRPSESTGRADSD